MNRLNEQDLRVLHVTAAYVEDMLPALVDGIARELYSHPDALPFYASIEQVRAQSSAWIRGVLGHTTLQDLDAALVRVARIHRRIGITEAFFVEVCAMIGDHIADAADAQPISEEVRMRVVRTFHRVLFRQVALFCSEPAP